MAKLNKYLSLVAINLIYAIVYIFSKQASLCEVFGFKYFLWISGAILVMGIYAILWQQIIRRIEMSTAYMFKGTSLIFVLLISWLIFGEQITCTNIIGSLIIISGIMLFAKA